MSLMRFTAAMLSSIGLAIVLSGRLSAAYESPPPGRDVAEQSEARALRAPGPPPGRGPGPRGGFGGRRQVQPNPPGPPPGGIPNRIGPPGRPGSLDERGPHRLRHPSGPPRWPFQNWDGLEKIDPEMYKLLKDDYDLERRARELTIQYRRAATAQRTEIKQQLTQLVNKHFDVRQERRLLELKRLEEELKRLRDAIDQRSEARAELVGKRVSELLGKEELDF